MFRSTCWKCLLRPLDRHVSYTPGTLQPPKSTIRGLSSSASLRRATASQTKKKPPPGQKKPPPKTFVASFKVKKKAVVKTGRPPAPGERKALRKRVVLSNTNALEVPAMQDLTADDMTNVDMVGKVLGLRGEVVDQLRAAGAFKPTQKWQLFRRPGVLMRPESIELGKTMDGLTGSTTMSRVYTGNRGAGKSIILLQAMAMAFLKGWVVICFPEAQDLTIAHTDYTPLPSTSPTQYSQPTYTATLLNQIVKANSATLDNLQLSQKHNLPIPLQSNISLTRLAELGARDPDIAWPIFQALWAELMAPSEDAANRPRVMLALDGLGHVMRESKYRSAAFDAIHAHDLSLVRHFVSYLSQEQRLTNGGAVLAATSMSNNHTSSTLSVALEQGKARRRGATELPQPNPFEKHDERVLQAMQHVDVVELAGVDHAEARGLMEYYAASGLMRRKVDQQLVAERWTLASGGIVGELERANVQSLVA